MVEEEEQREALGEGGQGSDNEGDKRGDNKGNKVARGQKNTQNELW